MKRWDEENGEPIEKYKKIVKQSMAAIENFNMVKATYYIHSSRKKANLKLKKWVIPHEEVMEHLQKLYPYKKFSQQHSAEFRILYD